MQATARFVTCCVTTPSTGVHSSPRLSQLFNQVLSRSPCVEVHVLLLKMRGAGHKEATAIRMPTLPSQVALVVL